MLWSKYTDLDPKTPMYVETMSGFVKAYIAGLVMGHGRARGLVLANHWIKSEIVPLLPKICEEVKQGLETNENKASPPGPGKSTRTAEEDSYARLMDL